MNLLANMDPGLTGLEQLRALIAGPLQPSIFQTLSLRLIEVDLGFAAVEGLPGDAHLNPAGTIHGGWIATILDWACACAGHSALPSGVTYTTLELKISCLRAITPETGLVRAEGRVLSMGRRAGFSEATLSDASGRVLAAASSSLIVLQPPT